MNWVMLLLSFGGITALMVAIERFRIGLNPGLGLITAGLIIPLALLSYYYDYRNMLSQFKDHLYASGDRRSAKKFFGFFVYLGILIVLSYTLWTNFIFLFIFFGMVAPIGSLLLVRLLKEYM